jgi:hypothetical protein
MAYAATPQLADSLAARIHQRTGWRVRNLAIEILPDRAIVRGQASSHVSSRLALNIIRDLLPHIDVENALGVDDALEVLPGMPLS